MIQSKNHHHNKIHKLQAKVLKSIGLECAWHGVAERKSKSIKRDSCLQRVALADGLGLLHFFSYPTFSQLDFHFLPNLFTKPFPTLQLLFFFVSYLRKQCGSDKKKWFACQSHFMSIQLSPSTCTVIKQ